ncbi:hypothetical protein ACQ4PT_012404 [Festuca glaucescens]
MGQTQSLLLKSTLRDENDRIKYATSSMQGLCSYMEDAHATILDLDHTGSTSFFGVYDGHGGANVALYCANRFHTELLQDEDYQNNLDDAVGHVFFRMDEQLREYDEWRALANPRRRFSFSLLNCLKAPACVKGTPYSEGSTASVALIRGNQIIFGSVGDSRCVLSRNGQVWLLIPYQMSRKANPAMGQTQSLLLKSTLRDENDRIKYATSSMQGLCSYMEDAHATILDLDHTGSTSFFGVYDGHGGDRLGGSQVTAGDPPAGRFWCLSSPESEDDVAPEDAVSPTALRYLSSLASTSSPSASGLSSTTKRMDKRIKRRQAAMEWIAVPSPTVNPNMSASTQACASPTRYARSLTERGATVLEPSWFVLDHFDAAEWITVHRKTRKKAMLKRRPEWGRPRRRQSTSTSSDHAISDFDEGYFDAGQGYRQNYGNFGGPNRQFRGNGRGRGRRNGRGRYNGRGYGGRYPLADPQSQDLQTPTAEQTLQANLQAPMATVTRQNIGNALVNQQVQNVQQVHQGTTVSPNDQLVAAVAAAVESVGTDLSKAKKKKDKISDVLCFKCDTTGHFAADCTAVLCLLCDSAKHASVDCHLHAMPKPVATMAFAMMLFCSLTFLNQLGSVLKEAVARRARFVFKGGTTDLRTICEGLLNHCIKSRDNMTVILVQFKPAARIPLPAPPAAMPVIQPSASETSSAANSDASAEAKAGTGSEIKEDPPASVSNA